MRSFELLKAIDELRALEFNPATITNESLIRLYNVFMSLLPYGPRIICNNKTCTDCIFEITDPSERKIKGCCKRNAAEYKMWIGPHRQKLIRFLEIIVRAKNEIV